MPAQELSLTSVFQYKDKIKDSVLTRENTGQRKPLHFMQC